MNAFLVLIVAALAVAPSDRLALGDRLFNKGEYALAASEYAALKGETAIAADELLYRMAECDRALGKDAAAQVAYRKILSDHPLSAFADTARLRLALAASGDEKVRGLKLLDSDRVKSALRAEALFYLGEATNDADAYERCAKADPGGRYHGYAILRRAAILSKSASEEDRRLAVSLFLEIAFGKDAALSESALYLAAATSFADRKYGEAGSLVRRYLKNHSNGKHASKCAEMAAWCDYLGGRFADAIALCGEGRTDGLAYVRAAATQASGDDARARKLLSDYLVAYPQGRYRKDAELALSRLDYAAAEASDDAAKRIESARRSFALSGSASDQVRLAWAYEKAGKHDEAAREYVAVAEKHPGTAEAATAMFQKAMIDLRAERWSAADLALSEALANNKIDKRHVGEARYWRGMAACRLGHETEGALALKAALDAGLSLDQTREAKLAIADIDYNAGRTNDAVTAYAQLVREGATARMSAAKTLAVGRLMAPAEKKLCAEALAKSESPAWRQAGFALLAEAEGSLGNLAAEQAALEKCAAENCETEALGKVAVKLGWLRSKYGDHAGAEAILKRAVALNAKDNGTRAEAYLALATNALAKGDKESAKGYATVVVTLFENTPQAKGAAGLLKTLEAK